MHVTKTICRTEPALWDGALGRLQRSHRYWGQMCETSARREANRYYMEACEATAPAKNIPTEREKNINPASLKSWDWNQWVSDWWATFQPCWKTQGLRDLQDQMYTLQSLRHHHPLTETWLSREILLNSTQEVKTPPSSPPSPNMSPLILLPGSRNQTTPPRSFPGPPLSWKTERKTGQFYISKLFFFQVSNTKKQILLAKIKQAV